MDLTAHEEIDAEEVDTMGGLVFLLAGHVAQAGEVVVHPDGPPVRGARGRRAAHQALAREAAGRDALTGSWLAKPLAKAVGGAT
jgi:hypothetical protein